MTYNASSGMLTLYSVTEYYTGHKPGIGRRPTTGCAHSKIACVRMYYLYCMWLPLLTSL